MKKVLFIFTLLLYLVMSFSPCFAETKDSIETELEKCLSKAISNADMRTCTYNAMNSRFNEIDKYLGLIRKVLAGNAEKLKTFEISQSKWGEYQKAEFEVINALIHNKGGTIYTVMAVGDKYALVKKRADNLKYYYDIITRQ